jgi:hypothetical protein
LEAKQHALDLVHIHFGMLIMTIKLILMILVLLEDGKNQILSNSKEIQQFVELELIKIIVLDLLIYKLKYFAIIFI